jgi:RNA ligase
MIKQIQSIEDIQALVREGFSDWQTLGNVTVRAFDKLLIFNYNQLAQYAEEWNIFEILSRGLIIHSGTGEIVARSFDKFFNWGEKGRYTTAPIVNITEKLDGSLGILYRHEGGYRIATRGSLESEQALWATDYLNRHFELSSLPDELTLLFEIIYPGNRIVVDYEGREDLVLLAARNRFTGEFLPYSGVKALASLYSFNLPKVYRFEGIETLFSNLEELTSNEEGFVAEFADGQRFKFKGKRYLELHKLISTLSFKNVLAAMESGALEQYLEAIPDEFLTEARQWIAQIDGTIASEKARLDWIFAQSPKDHTRREFALWVNEHHKQDSRYLFALLDNKPLRPIILKHHEWGVKKSYPLRGLSANLL